MRLRFPFEGSLIARQRMLKVYAMRNVRTAQVGLKPKQPMRPAKITDTALREGFRRFNPVAS